MFPISNETPAKQVGDTNWFIIFICFTVYLLQGYCFKDNLKEFYMNWGLVPCRLLHHIDFYNVSTLVSSMFLHAGLMHFFMNMWFLYLFGEGVEQTMGRFRYLLFYITCGIIAGLAQTFSDPDSSMVVVGASGAISGVLGAYLVLYPDAQMKALLAWNFYQPVTIKIPTVGWILIWFFIQCCNGLFSSVVGGQSHIAWAAHIGGFFAGLLLIKAFEIPGRNEPAMTVAPSKSNWKRVY